MRVFKYPLTRKPNEYGGFEIQVPSEHKVLSAIVQNNDIVIYVASTKDEQPTKTVEIHVVGTGKEMSTFIYDLRFIGTVQQGPFVWHIFAKET